MTSQDGGKPKLLIVEDDLGLQKQLKWSFGDYEVLFAEDREAAIAALRRFEPPVVLQDLGLPPDPEGVTEGMATLREIVALAPETKVIVATGHGEREHAVEAIGIGAYDFYSKPLELEVLELVIQRAFRIYELEQENKRLLSRISESTVDGLVATSVQMIEVCKMIEKVAPTSATTLILGESGTGKELLARALHNRSGRDNKRFVAINCAAIPDNLLESELFGYEKGAFTGATSQTQGKIETADGGTLFLDEIGDMPPALQAKMLRFLQERVIERVGGRKEIPVDVRVVCATNRDLKKLTETGEFREDLYYRVSEIAIDVPPVRERDGEKPVLARALLRKAIDLHNKTIKGFTADALTALENYDWPGNVREMENRINRAVIVTDENYVSAKDLGLEATDANLSLNLKRVRELAEYSAVRRALAVTDGNISQAAEYLGITRPTLYSIMAKLGIKNEDAGE